MDYYKQYAEKVVNGYIKTCELTRLSCKRYLRFFDKYDFKPEKVEQVIKFIERLKHFKQPHSGKPFKLLDFQKWVIYAIFGFYHRGTDDRVTRNVYIEVARKNGKTAFMAAVLLYLTIAERGADTFLVANSRAQAGLTYEYCSEFAKGIDRRQKYFKPFRNRLLIDRTKSSLSVLASDFTKLDGLSASAFILDEMHEMKDERLFNVMISSQGARTNPLSIITTTAGFNKHGFCYKYRTTCTDILQGLKEKDSVFAAIYTLDDWDDFADEKVWVKSNPSLGAITRKEYLREEVISAQQNVSLEVGVKTKNFNVWCDSLEVWIPEITLQQSSKNLSLTDFRGELCYVGVDLAAVSDLTAVSYMIPRDDKFYFKTDFYLPYSALSNNPNAELYKDWKRRGLLKVTPDNVTDYDYILADMLKASEEVIITKVAYDAYNSTQWAIQAVNNGLPLIAYSQGLWNFNKPTKELERLFLSGKIVIDNNEITRYCFANVSLKYDHNDNVKPIKTEAMKKIDATISMIQALGIYLEEPQFNNEITII